MSAFQGQSTQKMVEIKIERSQPLSLQHYKLAQQVFFQLVTKVTLRLYPRVMWLNPLPIPICHAIVFYELQGISSLPAYLF